MTHLPNYNAFQLNHYENAVNSAAARARGLWLGHVALVTYLVITVGAVTHRDLLLENPVKMPVINIDLPLVGFFLVAPVFFVINHFYLLMSLAGLRRRIQAYNRAVRRNVRQGLMRPMTKRTRRLNLDTFVLVLAFGGGRTSRSGLSGILL